MWANGKGDLYNNINAIEVKIEKQEKHKRGNNTTITGFELEAEEITEELETFINKELQINAKIKDAYNINTRNGIMHT